MKVLFLTQYGILAASSRTRVFQYLPYLEEHGVEHRVIVVLPDRKIGESQILVTRDRWRKLLYYIWAAWRTFFCGLRVWRQAAQYDLLFIQKVILPAPIRWLLGRRRPRLVFDFDDAIFTTEVRGQNWLAAWKHRRNAAGLPAMLSLADQAVVENEYTASFARRYAGGVTIITGPIDTKRYRPLEHPRAKGELVLGWIGSATTFPYLETIRSSLERLGQRFSHLRLRIIGASGIQWQGIRVEAKPWCLQEEVEDLQDFDVGLMPIPDDPWTRGKGGYKLLQYMATGLPVVTSPVGINRQIVRHGRNGFWASTPEEWEDYLTRLIEDERLRREMGREGRRIAEEEYALDRSSRRLLEMMERTMEEKRR